MPALKTACKLFLALPFIGGVLFLLSKQSVRFESIESQTTHGGAVFNEVSFHPSAEQDVWLMKQSHSGEKLPTPQWEQVLIKIDKRKSPYKVSYHQLKDGVESEYRASCYLCHPHGPRVLRPNLESLRAPLNLKNRLSLNLLNLRIKLYGKMSLSEQKIPFDRKVPLYFKDKNALAPLKLASCTICHHDGWFGRGTLTRQQALPIAHLIAKNQMPPWPFKLNEKEKEQIDLFLKGF